MNEGIDSQAREDTSELGTRLTQLEMVVWGIDKNNGLRSVVAELVRKVTDLITRLNHYIDCEREETCHGLEEFARRDSFKAEIDTEVTEVEVAKINANVQRDVGKMQSRVTLIVQVLTLIGVLAAVFK